MPSCEPEREDPAPLTVIIRFELPVPIRVEKLLTTGFGLSRSAVRAMVDSGRIRLPMAIDAKAREDFTLFVSSRPPRKAIAAGLLLSTVTSRWSDGAACCGAARCRQSG